MRQKQNKTQDKATVKQM